MVFCCFGCVLKKVSGCWFLALLEAAAAIKIRDQIGESLNSSRILERTLQLPGNLLLRLILRHFRHEIRWCFAVSGCVSKKMSGCWFLAFIEAQPKLVGSALHSSDWASSALQTCTEFVALPQNCFLVAKYTLSIPSNYTHLANFYIYSYGRVARDPSSFPLFPGSAAGAAALKSGQGPPGRGIAEGVSLLSVGERGRRPSRRPPGPAKNYRVLRCFVLVAFFRLFPDLVVSDGSTSANIGLKMGQHRPQDGPT